MTDGSGVFSLDAMVREGRAEMRKRAAAQWAARPAQVHTPWGEVVVRSEDGFYRPLGGARRGARLSWGALEDECSRYIERGHPIWRITPGGNVYLAAGGRLITLRCRSSLWQVGHCALTGERDGRWLSQTYTKRGAARREAERFAASMPGALIDTATAGERLDR